jgi:hypothetical protein
MPHTTILSTAPGKKGGIMTLLDFQGAWFLDFNGVTWEIGLNLNMVTFPKCLVPQFYQ